MLKAKRAEPARPLPEAGLDSSFYIAVTGAPSPPRLTLKHNDVFVVLDSHGDIGATNDQSDGLFDCDTRFLSHLQLLLYGSRPLLLGSNVKDDNLHLDVDLTNPDIYFNDQIILLKDVIHVAKTIYVHDGNLRARIALTNHGDAPVELNLSLEYDNDFADLFEVRGLRRERRGHIEKQVVTDTVLMTYRGIDGKIRETAISFEPRPTSLRPSVANYKLRLMPRVAQTILVLVSCRGREKASVVPFLKGLASAHRERRTATRDVATIETSNALLNEVLCRSMADLYMLVSATPQGPYPYAGIPWYSTTFGRDGLITAMQMLWFDPQIARGVLKRLAHYQADVFDAKSDAEPGKILHEMRGGEMAALGEVPFGRYYGSINSTPLFVMLAGRYAARTGDYQLIEELWPAIERALEWIDRYGDIDGDGFVEYARRSEHGLINQGWKDSLDSIFHADGRLAQGPIALVEVQGYVYAAKRLAATCASRLGRHEQSAALDAAAEELRTRFEQAFWCDDIETYAVALDGAKKPCRVRTSNAGQTLFTGIVSPARAHRVVKGLLQSAFYSGWGIRTLATTEARFNPMSYHNGSIWPHDNALIAAGMRRYGMASSIGPVFHGLTRAAMRMDQHRLPELFCGFRQRKGRGPTLYPVACTPQAWASGTVFQLLQSLLGLEFDPSAGKVELWDPFLPTSVKEICVRNLRIGASSADFVISRNDGKPSLRVLRTTGQLSVLLKTANPT